MVNDKDTICAIATPPGQGGIGIVRVSGKNAARVLKKVWRGKVPVAQFGSHKMYFGSVKDIDTALAVIMKGPRSYTGEDVVEISSHGGPAVLEQILGACKDSGARLAEPGEFTKRAFMNGKMDLAQAEAVADLISATTEAATRLAKLQLEGRLSGETNALMSELTKLRAFVEASIDFPEEDIDFIKKEGIEAKLAAIHKRLTNLAGTYSEGRLMHDGVRVAMVGRPNVGKSSLFNALVGHERAIVHHASGTTRDIVSETVKIKGVAFHFTDAAGLHESEHEVERIGIKKAQDSIADADIVLFVLDGSRAASEEDLKIYTSLPAKRTVICINKSDLPKKLDFDVKGLHSGGVFVSALKKDGIGALKDMLTKRIAAETIGQESIIITSARHKAALDRASEALLNAIRTAKDGGPADLTAHHLAQAHDIIGEITGKVSSDAVLNEIFSRFCIGK